MAYILKKYNGSQLAVIDDGSINKTTDLTMVGLNYSSYGTVQNENFVYLLENFAGNSAPTKPLTGQLWYDTSVNKLKVIDTNLNWKAVSGADISTTKPSKMANGDFWYDTVNNQLYVYSNTASSNSTPGYTLIGPNLNTDTAKVDAITVIDTLGNSHNIFEAVINGTTVFTVSADSAFILDDTLNSIEGFSTVQQGITLCNTANLQAEGQTTTNHRFWGTATNADSLNVIVGAIKTQAYASSALPNTQNLTSIVSRSEAGDSSFNTVNLAQNLNFTGSSRLLGDFSNSNIASRVYIQSNQINQSTYVGVLPNGSDTTSSVSISNNSNPLISSWLSVNINSSEASVKSDKTGTGTYLPLSLYNGGTKRLTITPTGNVLVTSTGSLGYGLGSGGAVTQLVSRTTGVTIDKPTGQITLFTAAGSTSWASFVVTNSLVEATDTISLSVTGATNTYMVGVSNVGTGQFTVTFSSVIGTASDTPIINFAIIKASIS